MMPDAGEVDIFDEFDAETAKKVLDMYFYVINQWREYISAYVSQNEPSMRQKVMCRLTEVIELEQRVNEILASAPEDYMPPSCRFLTATRPVLHRFKRPAGNFS